MKYGGVAEEGGTLSVTWQHAGDGDQIIIDWVERRPSGASSAEPESGADTPPGEESSTPSSGFGTRLIDASIRLELNGSIERSFDASETRISISIPLNGTDDEAEQS